jgi:hypothetical protein
VSEARTEDRLDRLEADVHEIKTTLARVEPMIIRIDAQLPRLATKAELEKKPGHAELWGAIAAMVGAQAVLIAVLAVILSWPHPAHGMAVQALVDHARQDQPVGHDSPCTGLAHSARK